LGVGDIQRQFDGAANCRRLADDARLLRRLLLKASLALVLSVFTGLVMSGTSQGERLGPGTTIGLFAAVVVSGFLYRKQ